MTQSQTSASSLIFQKPPFLQELAPSGVITEVAGLHRASPSATLDKRISQYFIYHCYRKL